MEETSIFLKDLIHNDLIEEDLIRELLSSTIVSIVISRIRELSLDIKKHQGYKIYNKNEDFAATLANKDCVQNRPILLKKALDRSNFTTGIPWLDVYLRENKEEFIPFFT